MTYSPVARLALQAAIGAREDAVAAFQRWQSAVDLDVLPPGQYALLPVIYSNLPHHGFDHPWMPRLRGFQRKMWYANQLALRAVDEAVAAFAATGVQPLLVGGAALACAWYPEQAMRPIVQPALVVPIDAGADALRILRSLGWAPQPASPHLEDPEYRTWVAGQRIVNANQQAMWIGWRTMPSIPCADLDVMCRKAATSLPLEAVTVRTLCPTDELLYACSIAGEAMLIALVDAAMLLRRGAIDWQRLLQMAMTYRLVLAVRNVLELLVQEVDVAVPVWVLPELNRQPVSVDDRRVQQIIEQAPETRGLAARTSLLWARYRRILACNGYRAGFRTFGAFTRYNYHLSSSWEVPFALARRATGDRG